jgi:hypothetical protein
MEQLLVLRATIPHEFTVIPSAAGDPARFEAGFSSLRSSQ